MSDLVKFEFHGDSLDVVERDGAHYVAVRAVCTALGVSEDAQRVKLKGRVWATTAMIKAVGEDGKNRQIFCLSLDSLAMWLATIDPGKVADRVREKLAVYQLECARVLRDHFMPRVAPETARAPSAQTSPAFEPAARISDNDLARADVSSRCRMAAAAGGYSLAKVHGAVRRQFLVPGIYSLTLSSLVFVREFLEAIALKRLFLKREPELKRLPGDRRQLTMFGAN